MEGMEDFEREYWDEIRSIEQRLYENDSPITMVAMLGKAALTMATSNDPKDNAVAHITIQVYCETRSENDFDLPYMTFRPKYCETLWKKAKMLMGRYKELSRVGVFN